MNILQMLEAASVSGQAPKETWARNTAPAVKTRELIAVAKYRDALTTEWSSTHTIELRCGMGRATVYKTLVRYEERGFIERRPLAGKPYNRRRGWEWRWIK
jgi:hypothetical protein